MKIGIIGLGYKCNEYLDEVLKPWISLRKKYSESIDKTIFPEIKISVSYGMFPEVKMALGQKQDIDDGSVSNLINYKEKENIDFLHISPEPAYERDLRNSSLIPYHSENFDLIWLLDLQDEIYTEKQILDIIEFIEEKPDIDWFRVNFKNYVIDSNKYIDDFTPPRIWRANRNLGIGGFYFDNEIIYRTGQMQKDYPSVVIPKSIAFVKHFSWVGTKERLQNKIKFQLFHYSECSYEWNYTTDKIQFNELYYKNHNVKIPTIYEDELEEIKECRLCSSKNLVDLLNFGNVALANSYPVDKNQDEKFYPLDLIKCSDCGNVQLRQTISPEVLFKDYLYSSSDSPGLVAHFAVYAKEILKRFGKKSRILEIGCNDGILLNHLKKLGANNLIGVDPATNLVNKSDNIINDFFNLITAKNIKDKFGKCDIICSNNTLAHIKDIDGVFQGIKELLSPNGVLIFENAYLLDTIKNLYFDQIYHEHLNYYGIKPLVKFLSKYDLEIFDIERVNIQGGSFRIYAKFKDNKSIQINNLDAFLKEEEDYKLYENDTYKNFKHKIESSGCKFKKFIASVLRDNKSISCYGCPAKFALLSKFFGMNNVKYVVDDSSLKIGRFTPGKKIPIVSNEYFKNNPTDYCIVTAWNFAEQIMKKNQDYKGKFVIPLPELKIV